ncbi:MAG: haloalkane dehalogenase [Actinomycetota bacterium]|jgi:pimeloyl-ACP methyl ester carboxylesterase|nr:haloalkane dehalogenase [Actinomycetota bacterium]
MMVDDKRRVRTPAGELAVIDVGEGPAVVLLHGFPLSSFQWRAFIPQLAPKFRVIAPDLLGAGDSDKPQDVAALGVRAQAAAIRSALDTMDVQRYAVLGAGPGGGVAQRLAVDDPRVDALVLLNCVAFDLWPSGITRDASSVPESQWSEALATAMIRTAFDLGMRHRTRLHEDTLAEYVRPYADPAGAAAFFRLVRAIDGTGLEDMVQALPELRCPTLILWGEEETFYPAETPERLNEAIMSSTLGLLPGCGHFVSEDAADTLVPMIFEYLRAKYLGQTHGHADPTGAVLVQLERRPGWVDATEFELDEEETLGEVTE